MGSSLRKKRRAKPSGSTVKVGRVKKTKQHVKVVPVRLPGAAEDTAWKEDTTHVGNYSCLLYTSPSPRDATLSRMPSSA